MTQIAASNIVPRVHSVRYRPCDFVRFGLACFGSIRFDFNSTRLGWTRLRSIRCDTMRREIPGPFSFGRIGAPSRNERFHRMHRRATHRRGSLSRNKFDFCSNRDNPPYSLRDATRLSRFRFPFDPSDNAFLRVKFLTFRNETFVPRTGDASIRVNRSCPHKYAPACAERQIIVARQIRRNNASGSYTADDIAPRNSVVSIVLRYVSYGNDLSVGVRETDVKEDEKPSVEEELYGAVRRLFLYL